MTDLVSENLAFGDVETTGLDSATESLLQIAVIVTDYDLNEKDPAGFERTVYYSPEDAAALYHSSDPFVQSMHTANGLWETLPFGTPLEQVDDELLEYLSGFGAKRSLRLAGNSVRLDLNFMEQHLPKSYEQLHYRFIDFTGVHQLSSKWFSIPEMQKSSNHLAMDDIRACIEQARFLKRSLAAASPIEGR
ncbi:oligoribonuclease [Lysinibacter cavernae]|uniref:oligoribonuclease n=1 Tax=Lysinibacter cavernae TaxID=1640652 RepID=UPI00361E5B57